MRINKILQIKKYKSFHNFEWNDFFNDNNNFEKLNIFFGENGTGKTSICRIFKNLSSNGEFEDNYPKLVEIQIDRKNFKYQNNGWEPNELNKDKILFFDKDFIADYIHLNAERKGDAGGHEQKSGKLIIEFDKKAIDLNKKWQKFKELEKKSIKENNIFLNNNKEILNFNLSEEEKKFFKDCKEKNKKEIKENQEELAKQISELSEKIKIDQENLKKTVEIQDISEDFLLEVQNLLYLSSFKTYYELFWFPLKVNSSSQAENILIKKIKSEKSFFEKGLNIYKWDDKHCPFCHSKNEDENIKKVLKVYNELYDTSYEKQKEIFEAKKRILTQELQNIGERLRNINIENIFDKLIEINEKFPSIKIFSLEEKRKFIKPEINNLRLLYEKISNLKTPNEEDIAEIYQNVFKEVKSIKQLIKDLNIFLNQKRIILQEFKNNNTNEKLQENLVGKKDKIKILRNELEFLSGNKVKEYYIARSFRKQKKKRERAKNFLEKEHAKCKRKYDEYCDSKVFLNFVEKIEDYIHSFNLNFTLQPVSRNTHTNQKQFVFEVFDKGGGKRSFKDGFSEGELQILSFSFFFAFLDSYSDKEKKVLIFDDPITSLDDGNLSKIVDIIFEKQKEFKQTFIFTHHGTFFKFLRKKFGKEDKGIFNILKNKKDLGGSFICKSNSKDKVDNLKNIENKILEITQGEGIDLDNFIIKYGQYLRYEVERFVKNKLLHMDKNKFGERIKGIKSNQKISNYYLGKIQDIYNFCNWSNTNHVGDEPVISLRQLKLQIEEFVKIYDKYK